MRKKDVQRDAVFVKVIILIARLFGLTPQIHCSTKLSAAIKVYNSRNKKEQMITADKFTRQ